MPGWHALEAMPEMGDREGVTLNNKGRFQHSIDVVTEGSHKNPLTLTTNFSKMLQNHLMGSVTQSVIFADISQN